MKSKDNILKIAKDSFTNQGNAILNLHKFLTPDFENAIKKIQSLKGRVIISGIGKSAIIGNKIVATLNSTGTPSIFMHAAEAIHGDLGIIQNDDIIILLSKSGNTPEIKNLIPFIKQRKTSIISITSEPNSYLAKNSDYFLNSHIEMEACINNLAPTTSTTVQLVIGDAIAICLSELNGFNKNDFAKHHPGGMLGKKLYLKAIDIINKNLKPQLIETDNFKTIIDVISKNLLGAAVVVKNNKPIGIITDGDIRRIFTLESDYKNITAKDIMSNNPLIIDSETLVSSALSIMNENKISQIVVTDNNNYSGLIHIHNILNEGLF